MMSHTLNVHEVADYFLVGTSDDAYSQITHLVLQKLLYYGQGFHLALQGDPLFEEDIQAWKHGPVVPSIYQSYRGFRKHPIARPDLEASNVRESLAPEAREILDAVWALYGQIPAWQLSDLTHSEPPCAIRSAGK